MARIRWRLPVALAATAAALVLPATAYAATSPQDDEYLRMAHQANLAEIASSKVAEQKATDERIRQVAQHLITDHTRLDADLGKVAGQLQVSLPTGADPKMAEQMREVSRLSGRSFDRAWVATQVKGHEQVLELGRTEQRSGTEAKVKQLAAAAAPVVEGHLRMLREIQGSAESPAASPAETPTR